MGDDGAQSAQELGAVVASAVHEMRNPVQVISGFTTLLEAQWDDADRDRLREMVAVLRRNAERLVGLIDDLLVVARLDAHAVAARLEDTEVLSVLSAAADIAAVRGVTVQVHCPPQLRVRTDPDRLTQIVAALVDNSCRHGVPPVVISATRRPAGIAVAVSDSGRGVPPGDLARLFERFSPASSGSNGSNGLGLYTARRLARWLHGDLVYDGGGGGGFVVTVSDGGHADGDGRHARQPVGEAVT